jgi:hypothetical protein
MKLPSDPSGQRTRWRVRRCYAHSAMNEVGSDRLIKATFTGVLLFLVSIGFAVAQTSDIKRNHVGTIRSIEAAERIVIFEFSERVSRRAVMLVTEKTRISAITPTRKRRKLTFADLKPGMRAEFVGIADSRYAWDAESIQVLEK